MATTIQSSFEKFRSNLEISDLQATTVSTRQTNVRKVVEDGMTVLDSFLTGSYSRSTMIAPLKEADIDIFVVLDAKYYHNYNGQNGGQGGLLDLVKRTLLKTYTTTPAISRNGQAVTIRFSDFMVDVVPGFYREGGGFLIPNSITKTWLPTDPKKHVELMSAANEAHNGDLVPLIKMIKAWNRSHSAYFRSFHLEVLALQILNNVTISNFSSGARYYFEKGIDLIKKQNVDPAGYGDDVGRYITGADVEEAVRRFQLAYDRAIKAEQYAANGRIGDAVEMWIKNFGGYFPAYG
ncbi:CBASS oligonucleotide cyclase [Bradyrhizobium japonicum]|uniref:CBASS oligonucleotide cyclase n=1 Tax=Bradyrhizobium japonicum TaxID=375 RepID=UPI001BA834DE|nr:CBASS oligonucleotide cyclase [Bradyrhizobium japonicum]MBR0960886.1 nucleotidyltransferase [Bradyrhizobium japonicum]